jgi:hypothetical protein
MTQGGYRAGIFETIAAPDRQDYVDKALYVVQGLPGVWRRCRAPKGDPADVGLLPCFCDGSIIYLEHAAAINEELKHADCSVSDPEQAAGILSLLEGLRNKRTDAQMKERAKSEPEAVAGNPEQQTGAESASSETAPGNTEQPADGPPEDGVDV